MAKETAFYFFAYAFLGWLMQSVYLSVRRAAPVAAGFLLLPFCPVYGFCMLFLIRFVYPLDLHPLVLFFACFAAAIVAEYATSLAFSLLFKTWLWDYRAFTYTLNGRISWVWSAFWGAAAMLSLLVIQPALETHRLASARVFLVLTAALLVDCVVHSCVLLKLSRRLAAMTALRAAFLDCIQHSTLLETPREWLELTNIHNDAMILSAIHEKKGRIVTYGDIPEEELAATLALIKTRYERRRRPSFPERRLLRAFPTLRVLDQAESLADLKL